MKLSIFMRSLYPFSPHLSCPPAYMVAAAPNCCCTKMHHAIHFVFEVSVFPGPSGSLNPPATQCTGRGSDEASGSGLVVWDSRRRGHGTDMLNSVLSPAGDYHSSRLSLHGLWYSCCSHGGVAQTRWPWIHPARNHSSWETHCYVHATLSLWQSHMTCLFPHFFSWRTQASGNDLSPIAVLSELVSPLHLMSRGIEPNNLPVN